MVQVGTELQKPKNSTVNKAWTGRSGELYLVTKMTNKTTVAYTMFSLCLRLKTFSVARQFRIKCLDFIRYWTSSITVFFMRLNQINYEINIVTP